MIYKIKLIVDTSISPMNWIFDAIEEHLDLDAGEELITYSVENVKESQHH